MAKAIVKKNTLNIKAILTTEDNVVMIQTEDMDEAIPLATYVADFDGQEVSISVAHATEL